MAQLSVKENKSWLSVGIEMILSTIQMWKNILKEAKGQRLGTRPKETPLKLL